MTGTAASGELTGAIRTAWVAWVIGASWQGRGYGAEAATVSLLREIIAEGQKNGEITRDFPVVHLAEFMEGLFNTVVRQWAVDLTGPHKLTERVRNAVEFFLRGAHL